MSLSWRERRVASLTPFGVRLQTVRPFWRRGQQAERDAACPADADLSWRPALALLDGLLQKEGAGASLDVILSGHFVRLQVLPWQDGLSGRREWQAYAAMHFGSVYGAAARDWEVTWSPEAPGAPMLACAVDREFMEALQALAAERGCRLASVRPAFALAWNRARGAFGDGAAALVLEERERFCAAFRRDGRWLGLRNLACGPEGADLHSLIARQSLQVDPPLAGGAVLVVGLDGLPTKSPALPPNWQALANGGAP